MNAPPPNPPTTMPMAMPFLSGNQRMPMVMVGMSAMPWPKADTKPYVRATSHTLPLNRRTEIQELLYQLNIHHDFSHICMYLSMVK